ncbi:hypothetical protein [Streptomyces sp. NPDC059092]|uniref:hypothetical protein n=1 Tax=Streptomyces sp. NPDC059092 TaxID=3346725 RepID=UPI00367AA4D8
MRQRVVRVALVAAAVALALSAVPHAVQGGRRLEPVIDRTAAAPAVPGPTTAQVPDTLLRDARRHGRGTVAVTLRETGDVLAGDAVDEGRLATDATALFERGTTIGPGRGIGLPRTADRVDSTGARLSPTRRAPTRFTLPARRGMTDDVSCRAQDGPVPASGQARVDGPRCSPPRPPLIQEWD